MTAQPVVDAFPFVRHLVLVMAEDAARVEVLQLARGERQFGCCHGRAAVEEGAVDVAGGIGSHWMS
ncbi:hypothetical protein [Streptomyces sp. NPDC097610]|uniref:hypothetical protein n=1 Tax=Streptomyces sp. NPDC097610 TaxID=3157227 RepID=UPI003323B51E